MLINNLKKIGNMPVVVATSENPNNNELVEFLHQRNISVYRGEENDVLSRFIGAAKEYGFDGIVRICSDNPFLDYRGVKLLITKAQASSADYIGFRINDTPSIKTHFGFWGEYVRLSALKRVSASTNDALAHEHVTFFIYTHPEKYQCEWIECPNFLQGRNDIRLTVDNAEDFENARNVYSALYGMKPDFDLEDVVNCVDNNEDLRHSMKRLIDENKK